MVTPSRRREVVSHLRTAYGVSERRTCRTVGMSRASYRYRSVADPQSELRVWLRDLATSRVRYGYRRLWVLRRREGYTVNHKRIYRLYREEGQAIRPKTPLLSLPRGATRGRRRERGFGDGLRPGRALQRATLPHAHGRGLPQP